MQVAMALLLLITASARAATSSQIIVLWPGGAPGSGGRSSEAETVRVNERGEHIVSNVHAPSITAYFPARDQATRTAVIVVPGGGHSELWMDHEGYTVAGYLADHGFAAFVLKYRLAHQQGSTYTVDGDELADLQRAIRVVRSSSSSWGLDPQRIGVLGFSAGGELAALSATRFDGGAPQATDPIDRLNSRPDFQALLYPALPKNMNVSPQTPPAFLLCGADDHDPAVPQGLLDLYAALRGVGVRAELHIYDGLGHGFGMRSGDTGAAAHWPQLFLEWLGQEGLAARQ